ncbi:hypothetical protein L3Q82_020952 [Scortum barcoo]|uniref:Uncharacterized protein n=1 Tax=Scortum barcoo TaxID=214431 RepID=A0ACB8V9W5_9TELE|nr:hypothetical protein L3Q82_020952 [Scortum barcoo]
MSHQGGGLRGRPRTRWRDYVSRLAWERLGVPPGRAGGSVWGEGSLGISAQTAASATRSRTKRMKKMKKMKTVCKAGVYEGGRMTQRRCQRLKSYINARTRLPGEALPVFAAEISRLVEEAFPTYGQNAKEGEKFRRFIAGIEPYLQLRCHEHGVKTLDSALQFALQIETAHHASKVFSSSHTLQCFSQAPVLPGVPPLAPTHLPTSSTPLGVHSTTSEDFRKMQRTLETLSEKVEQLQLEMQRDTPHRSSDYRSRQRSLSPDSGRGRSHYYPPDRNVYRDSSYERTRHT